MTAGNKAVSKAPFRMDFDISTIKHLGLQMYSTLPPVIGELVANAWDANASRVEITIPTTPLGTEKSELVIKDDGIGMSDDDIRKKYLIVGRDRRKDENTDQTQPPTCRPVMGRKGIGKFSAFGIAGEIEIESVHDGGTSRFVMNYDEMLKAAPERRVEFRSRAPSGRLSSGTAITLRSLTKYRSRSIPLRRLRRGLARRFAVVGENHGFEVVINGEPISAEERDLERLLAKDKDGELYRRVFKGEDIEPGRGWTVSGWIGALDRTDPGQDGAERGVAIMARGKMVQEPFLFGAVVGQQYALSYIVGELHAEFVDGAEDTISTSRNSLVWDTEANSRLLAWGQEQLSAFAREWAKKRGEDNRHRVEQHESYRDFLKSAQASGNTRALKLAEQLLRQAITKNPTADVQELEPVVRTCRDFLEFNEFWAITEDLVGAELHDIGKIFTLFREWEIVEAKEMSRVTEGRIETIKKLQDLIEGNALEVPELHNFLREFPWVIDPKWTLVADEVAYSSLLKKEFPEGQIPETNRRIDFLCVRESTNLVVVEIKRPQWRVSAKDLKQIEDYVSFVRNAERTNTAPESRPENVVGYLLCGDVRDTWEVREKIQNLEKAGIYVRKYRDLLAMVQKMHRDFLDRYDKLRRISEASV